MRRGLGFSADRIGEVFRTWNQGVLDSYLMEISADILTKKDADGQPLVEKILDHAGQKGTGQWTAINVLEIGVPLTLIGEAVFARHLSAMLEERVQAATVLPGPTEAFEGDGKGFVNSVRDALFYAAKIISSAQGYMLMREAAREYGWKLNYGGIALMWRGGCIIRSAFLRQYQAGLRGQSGVGKPPVGRFFRRGDAQRADRLAYGGGQGRSARHSGPGHLGRPGLL